MKNNEKLQILKDVATFAVSARENDVDLTYIFYGNSLSIYIFGRGKVVDRIDVYFNRKTLDQVNSEIRSFMELTVDKYYAISEAIKH